VAFFTACERTLGADPEARQYQALFDDCSARLKKGGKPAGCGLVLEPVGKFYTEGDTSCGRACHH
jgi:hypothetical protein